MCWWILRQTYYFYKRLLSYLSKADNLFKKYTIVILIFFSIILLNNLGFVEVPPEFDGFYFVCILFYLTFLTGLLFGIKSFQLNGTYKRNRRMLKLSQNVGNIHSHLKTEIRRIKTRAIMLIITVMECERSHWFSS